jgi:hypothetical protein
MRARGFAGDINHAIPTREETHMSTTTRMFLTTALVVGSASASFAQGVGPKYDVSASRPSSIDHSFAARRHRSTAEPGHRSFAAPRPRSQEPTYSSGANGPAWQNYFDNWLSQHD